jgi:oligopeptide/dipeptide ABC transporter ATP-binding protein
MDLGKIVELAPSDDIYTNPRHPYTAARLSAVPVPDPLVQHARRRILLQGELPSAANPPHGCRFHTRCWLRQRLGNPDICATAEPALILLR